MTAQHSARCAYRSLIKHQSVHKSPHSYRPGSSESGKRTWRHYSVSLYHISRNTDIAVHHHCVICSWRPRGGSRGRCTNIVPSTGRTVGRQFIHLRKIEAKDARVDSLVDWKPPAAIWIVEDPKREDQGGTQGYLYDKRREWCGASHWWRQKAETQEIKLRKVTKKCENRNCNHG